MPGSPTAQESCPPLRAHLCAHTHTHTLGKVHPTLPHEPGRASSAPHLTGAVPEPRPINSAATQAHIQVMELALNSYPTYDLLECRGTDLRNHRKRDLHDSGQQQDVGENCQWGSSIEALNLINSSLHNEHLK